VGIDIEEIVLVDELDNVVGYEEKQQAHENGGRLHRAFSVFIYNSAGQMLLQLRGRDKYHFGGLWTNACCSHPRRGEVLDEAVHQRLQFELGFDTELREVFTFIYKATDPVSRLTEHELDHVFVGTYDGDPAPNVEEVDDWKWADVDAIQQDVLAKPENYSPWFRIAFERMQNEFAPKSRS
jgi:isopentenyl-diphosphate delta-isomerase